MRALCFLLFVSNSLKIARNSVRLLPYVNPLCFILKIFGYSQSSLSYLSKKECLSCEPHECNKKQQQQKSSHRAGMKGKSPESSLCCCDELHHIYMLITPSILFSIYSGTNITFVTDAFPDRNIHLVHVIILWSKLSDTQRKGCGEMSRTFHGV